jgi:hypothetical protein
MPGVATWFAVIGLAALSTALAYIVFFQILRRSGATNVMLVTLLIPVTAIVLGYLVLGEQISSREIAGALVIGSALLLIDGRVLELFRRPAVERARRRPRLSRDGALMRCSARIHLMCVSRRVFFQLGMRHPLPGVRNEP